jgi:hypothetical protein
MTFLSRLDLAAGKVVLASFVASATLAGVANDTYAVTVNDCLSAKLKALGKASSLRARCAKRFASENDAVALAACLTAAQAKLSAFEKAENRYAMDSPVPCLTYDDTVAAGQLADELGSELPLQKANHSSPGAPSKCDAARVTCYAKFGASKLSCLAAAARADGAVDPACDSSAFERLEECLGKAGLKGDCTPPNIGASVARPVFEYAIRRAQCLLDEDETPGGCPACQSDIADACWFLGADGQSCTDVCSANARVYDEITRTLAGSDGILDACTVLAENLDVSYTMSGRGSCGNALGCAWYPSQDLVGQCSAPATTAAASLSGARRVCACE